jgi:D-serine deaminase-like pyridoxal phosphate-dependent protein
METSASRYLGADLTWLARVDELDSQPTPFLAIDLDVMEENIARMASYFAGQRASLRPHVKHHKCSAIAKLQVAAGASGITCSTTDEVIAMIDAGVDDVLLANVVTDPNRLDALATVAGTGRVIIAVDSHAAVDGLVVALERRGTSAGAVVDIDIGMGRNGVSSVDEAAELAEYVADQAPLRFAGLMAYEGHIMDIGDSTERHREVTAAFRPVVEAIEAIEGRGLDVSLVTGGSSATYRTAASFPFMTDVQAGTYVLMDATYVELIPEFRPALVAVATVATAAEGRDVVVNVGAKRLATDWGKPALAGVSASHTETSEEHNWFHLLDGPLPEVGDRVAVVPAHTCSTMAMYRRAFGCRGGRVERTLEIDGRDPLS